jgi:hypothetical protein
MGCRACLHRLSLLVALAACTTAGGARRAELRRALDEARLSRSPAEIWPEVRRFLHQRGYPLVGDDRLAREGAGPATVRKLFSVGFQTRVRADGSRVLETDPQGESRTRVRVEAMSAVAGGSRLRVRRIRPAELCVFETTESGDDDLELALLEHLDPAEAARVTGRPRGRAP